MKRSKFAEEKIPFALREAAGGVKVGEVFRKLGLSDATFFARK